MKESFKYKDLVDMSEDDKRAYARFDSIFRNNGFDPELQKHISMKDAMDIPNAGFMIPRVLTNFVQMGVEPLLIGTNLLQRIEYTPGMVTVVPAFDVLQAQEVAENSSLPIIPINVGGGATYGMNVRKHGLQLQVASRFIEQSTYPWVQYWLQLAGNALGRHKEEQIFSFITTLGVPVFDNSTASRLSGAADQPIKGITTGRNSIGKFNGSVTMDDIFDTYGQVLGQGFIPDTLVMHPMAWLMWVKDAQLRDFAMTAGGGSFFASFTGNAAAQAFGGQYNFNGLGQGLGQYGNYHNGTLNGGQTSTVQGLPQNQTSAPVLPSYLPINFRILVSPFVKFDPVTRTTDIMMFSSQHLGALIVDEDPHVMSWDEKQFGISNMAVQETYGLAILNEGQAIATLRNVAVRSNEFLLPARSIIDIGSAANYQQLGSVSVFDAATPIDPLSVV
jgi:hypothetical protein